MLSVEYHDSDVDNITEGTLLAKAGRFGTIEYEYQAEVFLTEDMGPSLNRAYILREGKPLAAWGYQLGNLAHCVGHLAEYGGSLRIETPYANMDSMLLESSRIGDKVADLNEGQEWAQGILQGIVATAILYNDNGIVGAWENHDSDTILVARGPTI